VIARVWRGSVPNDKAEGYERYLADSDRGVRDYRAIRGTRGAALLRRAMGDRVEFVLISFWDSEAAIREYAGPDIDRARYFDYDLECLIEPDPTVTHYEVVAGNTGMHD
jgi:heme-degrading monooxygenase HmoA